MTAKDSRVDGDLAFVEHPNCVETYLDPEYRTLVKHALWARRVARLISEGHGEIFATRQPNLPRHALWRPHGIGMRSGSLIRIPGIR